MSNQIIGKIRNFVEHWNKKGYHVKPVSDEFINELLSFRGDEAAEEILKEYIKVVSVEKAVREGMDIQEALKLANENKLLLVESEL